MRKISPEMLGRKEDKWASHILLMVSPNLLIVPLWSTREFSFTFSSNIMLLRSMEKLPITNKTRSGETFSHTCPRGACPEELWGQKINRININSQGVLQRCTIKCISLFTFKYLKICAPFPRESAEKKSLHRYPQKTPADKLVDLPAFRRQACRRQNLCASPTLRDLLFFVRPGGQATKKVNKININSSGVPCTYRAQ